MSADLKRSHAILVMAYAEPRTLAAALPQYAQLGWEVFVHLDASASLEGYVSALGDSVHLCRFIEDRHRIY
jgi:hypothetical protein